MYQELIKQKLQEELDIELKHVENVINFLNEGCTIPFIARYRKEWTGSMSDEKLRVFNEKYTYFNNLLYIGYNFTCYPLCFAFTQKIN